MYTMLYPIYINKEVNDIEYKQELILIKYMKNYY